MLDIIVPNKVKERVTTHHEPVLALIPDEMKQFTNEINAPMASDADGFEDI